WRVDLKLTGLVLAIAGLLIGAFAGTIEITNGTGGWDVWYVYISPASSSSWGDDWLGSEIMYDGETWEFDVTNGIWDVKLIDEDGDEYIRWNVPVHGTYTWYVTLDDLGEYDVGGSSTPVSHGGSAPVTIYNDLGSWTIWYIYVDPSDAPWGDDRLGSSLLNPGEELTVWVPANDYYDIRCIDEDDDSYTLWEVWIDEDGVYWSVDLGDLD
ncbi:hypothetical protein JW921_11545, partial [Candidatus Fermentibacterales bacterium]|nr:hypothetical protein [Candidatus Fermentibacterales bacterium]